MQVLISIIKLRTLLKEQVSSNSRKTFIGTIGNFLFDDFELVDVANA